MIDGRPTQNMPLVTINLLISFVTSLVWACPSVSQEVVGDGGGLMYNGAPFYGAELPQGYTLEPSFGSSPQIFDDSQGFLAPNGFDYSSALPITEGTPFTALPPQTISQVQPGAGGFIGANGGEYQILGDVTSAIPIGNSQYDSIPFLEERQFTQQRKLPELKIPQNDRELAQRIDALTNRFTHMPITIQRSTPGRLLRYSLIGGADESFLAPESAATDSNASHGELRPIIALGALCWNFPCANRRLMRLVDGLPLPTVGYGFQTRRGELLATLAFARVDRNYELSVEGKKFHVTDLIDAEKKDCSTSSDLSLLAIGLSHYSQNPDETWLNSTGETWSLAKILECETRRPVDWDSASSIHKLMAFTFLLARLKQSVSATTPEFSAALRQTESFLIAIKSRVWEIIGDDSLSSALFFRTDVELDNPYMKLYVNGKLLLWLSLVSSPDEMQSEKMRRAFAELCALVDQLFNSLDNLDGLSATDEESLATAMQALAFCRKHMSEPPLRVMDNSEPLTRDASSESESFAPPEGEGVTPSSESSAVPQSAEIDD